MDWKSTRADRELIGWLEGAYADRYARERKLDPFATSMRDFDDVAENLVDIRAQGAPDVSDPNQRITDLKNAGLVAESRDHLSGLGDFVLDAWVSLDIANGDMQAELLRHVVYVLGGIETKNRIALKFYEYWMELRSVFDPLELISEWDCLYALNYLDCERDGFCPGQLVRKRPPSVGDLEFDLDDYVAAIGAGPEAIAGAERLHKAVSGKIPRGRHRATFCMAMEIVASDGAATAEICKTYGIPKKVGTWERFDPPSIDELASALPGFGVGTAVPAVPDTDRDPSSRQVPRRSAGAPGGSRAAAPGSAKERPELLPSAEQLADLDFSELIRPMPQPRAKMAANQTSSSGGAAGQKKTDFAAKADANEKIGAAGEDVALAYERWRLKGHPKLAEKIDHVSRYDDTLGYDIKSFNEDGTDRFVEVKSTTGPMSAPFFLSANEVEVASKLPEAYVILRLAGLGSSLEVAEIGPDCLSKLDLEPTQFRAAMKAATDDTKTTK